MGSVSAPGSGARAHRWESSPPVTRLAGYCPAGFRAPWHKGVRLANRVVEPPGGPLVAAHQLSDVEHIRPDRHLKTKHFCLPFLRDLAIPTFLSFPTTFPMPERHHPAPPFLLPIGSSASTPITRRGSGVEARRARNSALQWGGAGPKVSAPRTLRGHHADTSRTPFPGLVEPLPSGADVVGLFLETRAPKEANDPRPTASDRSSQHRHRRLRPAPRSNERNHSQPIMPRDISIAVKRAQTVPGRSTSIHTPLDPSIQPRPTSANNPRPPRPHTTGKGSSASTPNTRRGCGVGARRPPNSALEWGAAGANPSCWWMGVLEGFRMGFGWVCRRSTSRLDRRL